MSPQPNRKRGFIGLFSAEARFLAGRMQGMFAMRKTELFGGRLAVGDFAQMPGEFRDSDPHYKSSSPLGRLCKHIDVKPAGAFIKSSVTNSVRVERLIT